MFSTRFNLIQKKFRILVFFLLLSSFYLSQCYSGYLGISGSGCGCLSGCDLTSFGGPNCSPSVSGDCAAKNMSVSIYVPLSCTITVTAIMSVRTSCSASGADSGDNLKVDIIGGVKTVQSGSNNATISDSYTLNGAGTIIISGRANRADEIITYNVSSLNCSNCFTILPIDLIDFNGYESNGFNRLEWSVASERDNDYYVIEKSLDGLKWDVITQINGYGTTTSQQDYYTYDNNVETELNYYKLSQVDFNGSKNELKIIAIDNKNKIFEIIKITNILGQEVDNEYIGVKLFHMSNGEIIKKY